jgi:hypothetical protein
VEGVANVRTICGSSFFQRPGHANSLLLVRHAIEEGEWYFEELGINVVVVHDLSKHRFCDLKFGGGVLLADGSGLLLDAHIRCGVGNVHQAVLVS